LWKPAFKKWFVDKTEMDYKTLYTEWEYFYRKLTPLFF
jgi:hypothetical protein